MREIKFRGRDGDDWYYGSLFVNECGHTAISAPKSFWMKPVNAETVGQFTGMYDAEGREIYEGDIIKVRTQNPYWRFRRNYVVEWGTDGWLLDGDSLYSWFSLHTLEVIGNIHDNPDLLEVEHDRRD